MTKNFQAVVCVFEIILEMGAELPPKEKQEVHNYHAEAVGYMSFSSNVCW